jgi:two-component system chemotaxis response regulator CheY
MHGARLTGLGENTVKVLIVDDSTTIRKIQRSVLQKLGYSQVLEAADGQQALALFQREVPDLMLVGWNMPNMDGITLVKRIRQSDKAVPIIMCTAESDKVNVIEALKAGVNNYIVKPFTVEALTEKVRQTLAKLAVPAKT